MGFRGVALLLLFASVAVAQPSKPGEAEYLEGRRFYDLREWDKSIASFKEAYRLRSDAASLFNIAQAYRLKGDCVEASAFYKTYKRNFPDATNIAFVDKLIADLETCAQQQAAAAKVEPTNPIGPRPPHQVVPAPIADRGRPTRVTGLAIGGVGAVLVGTGFVFGALARSRAADVTNGGNAEMPPVFDSKLEDSGRRFDTLAKVSWGVGVAAIAGGVVLYMMGKRNSEPRVALVPHAHGALVVWTLRP